MLIRRWLFREPRPAPVPEGVTWIDAQAKWIEKVRNTRREKTAYGYDMALRLPEFELLHERIVSTITRQEVTEALAALHARGAERQAQICAVACRRMFKWLSDDAQRRKYKVEVGVMKGLEAPEESLREGDDAPEPEHVPEALEVGRIAHWLRDGDPSTERNRLAGLLVLYSVQRRSCVAKARKEDFKTVDGVHVWCIQPMHRRTASIKARNGKRVGERVLPLPPAAWRVIEHAIELCGDSEWIFPSMRPRRAGDPMAHMDPTLVTHTFYDIPKCESSPQDMRRAFGTTFGNAAPLRKEEIALILDHSEDSPSGDVTTTHYAWLHRLAEKAPILSRWADWVDAQEIAARPIVEAEEKAEAEKKAREAAMDQAAE